MLLRSSSTPVLGSLLSSFTDSPNNTLIHSESSHALKHLAPTSVPQHPHKLNFHQFSCTSSPISPSIEKKGFRRVQSEGNLEDLTYPSCNEDRFHYARNRCMALETIPSFSVGRHNKRVCEEEEQDDEEWESDEYEDEEVNNNLVNSVNGLVLREEVKVKGGVCRVNFGEMEKEMHLAKGLGIEGCVDGKGGCCGGGGGSGSGGRGDFNSMGSGGNDGDRHEVEEYYKRMVRENPGNPLFLRNYAKFLYQCKEDREGAEEFYSRAILADPNDGEVLSQYGKLVWELHHDQERASSYFERAVQASPEDSHVQAAYASFLWDTEEGEDDCNEQQCLPPQFHQGAMATAGA